MGVWLVLAFNKIRGMQSNKITEKMNGSRDTVAAVGVLMIRTLPFTNFNSSIKVFRHALSLDEVILSSKPPFEKVD